jgi:hypothetical protein
VPEDDVEDFIKEVGFGTPIIEECVRAWMKKYPQVPFVKLEGQTDPVAIKPRLWRIVSNGRITSWRLHLPLKISSAISVSQAQCMKFSKLAVFLL